jgi:small subunit ribosomal protein S6
LKEYEAMVIIDPDMEDEKIEASVAKIEGLIKKNGGEIDKVDHWGKRKLAYPINKQPMGYYAVLYFKGKEDGIKEMDRVMRISDDVIRHMIVAKEV